MGALDYSIYDDVADLLEDSDYGLTRCGQVIHVDDVGDHDDQPEECELCIEMDASSADY